MKFVSVILAGGAGLRLWPVSRQALPKPFMKIGGSTLFEQAVRRGTACGTDDCIVVTNREHYFLCNDEIKKTNIVCTPSYILEPDGRNTAPAIALAAFSAVEKYGEDVVLLVLSADHLIPNDNVFIKDVLEAKRQAENDNLVVFGIRPTSPETGYGYINTEKADQGPQAVLSFTEKPSYSKALEYLSSGQYLWNSGMFCFTASTYLRELKKCSPEVYETSDKAFKAVTRTDEANSPGHVMHLDKETFSSVPNISVDYAVMERSESVVVVPAKFSWSDVGTWASISEAQTPDNNGNTLNAREHVDWVSIDTKNTHVHVESTGAKAVVATVGVENLSIIHTPDAILVCEKNSSQKVKDVVEAIKQKASTSQVYQTTVLPHTVRRPWGTYTSLKKEEPGYHVKRITVSPGQLLSLQYHHHRAEHWTVVEGRALVQVGNDEFELGPGEYKYIPLGAIHRLTNRGDKELVVIEVQVGSYLGEDDIVRIDDIYGRR